MAEWVAFGYYTPGDLMTKQKSTPVTKKKPRRRKSRVKLIRAYAENLPGGLLGVFWKEFHELLKGHGGVYILYKGDAPHYVGKASSLASRIRHHQKDRLKKNGRPSASMSFAAIAMSKMLSPCSYES